NLSLASDPVDAKSVFQVLSVFGLAPRDTEISGPMGLHMTVTGPSNNLATQIRGLFKDVKVNGKRALKGNLSGEVCIKLPNGGGTMTLNQPTLDMAIETALSGLALSRAGRGRTATFFKDSQGRIVVPLKITGPLENPSVNLDSEKLLKRGMGENTEKGLGSF